MESEPTQVNEEIRALRKAAGINQITMAKHLGVTQAQVSRIESGESGISIPKIKAWYQLCGYEYLGVGVPTEGEPVTNAIHALDEAAKMEILEIVAGWPTISAEGRRSVLALVYALKK